MRLINSNYSWWNYGFSAYLYSRWEFCILECIKSSQRSDVISIWEFFSELNFFFFSPIKTDWCKPVSDLTAKTRCTLSRKHSQPTCSLNNSPKQRGKETISNHKHWWSMSLEEPPFVSLWLSNTTPTFTYLSQCNSIWFSWNMLLTHERFSLQVYSFSGTRTNYAHFWNRDKLWNTFCY